MITLFIIGMVVLTVKLVALTLSVTWGLTKTILFGVGLPVILTVLFIAGLTVFAVPLLILALLGVFLLPLFRHLRKRLLRSAWDAAARLS